MINEIMSRFDRRRRLIPGLRRGRAPARAAVDCPITTSGAAPLIVDGFRRVRRSTFTEGAIMERAEYNRQSRARMAETAKTRRDMERRTRRSASTIGGAAPDTIIGRAAADRAGARLYRATRCENASKCATPDRARACPSYQLNVRRRIARERVATTRHGYPAQAVGRHLILGRSFHLR